jgi:hypothetical protein
MHSNRRRSHRRHPAVALGLAAEAVTLILRSSGGQQD